ncbi:MAG: hypothetical protein O2904_01310 [bacterium]|nr:hypothetical protein [bacterium]
MTKKHTNSSHRHFVAAPALALVIGISLFQGSYQASVSELSTGEEVIMGLSEGVVSQLPSGAQVTVYSGDGFDASGSAFLNGTALVSSDGVSHFTVGNMHIVALAGAFHVSYHSGDISIAALTTPVLVRDALHRVLVPSGLQWKGRDGNISRLSAGLVQWKADRKLDILPQRFIVRQLQNLSYMPSVDSADLLPASRNALPASRWSTLPALRMQGAQDRTQHEWQTQLLGTLRSRIESKDIHAVQSLLSVSDYGEAFQSEATTNMIIHLMHTLDLDSAMTMVLLTHLIVDEDIWLLSSLDPRWREVTWTLFGPDSMKESIMTRLFALPASDNAAQAASAFLIERWVQEILGIAGRMDSDHSLEFLEEVIATGIPLVADAQRLGYPERARRLAEALLTLGSSVHDKIPEEMLNTLQTYHEFEKINVAAMLVTLRQPQDDAPEEVVLPQAQDDIEEVAQYSPDIVEARTYAILRDMGAVFAVNTEIRAMEPNTARVRRVIFSTAAGDLTFDFHFNIAKGEISQIIQDGKEFPYSLPLETFSGWIKGA